MPLRRTAGDRQHPGFDMSREGQRPLPPTRRIDAAVIVHTWNLAERTQRRTWIVGLDVEGEGRRPGPWAERQPRQGGTARPPSSARPHTSLWAAGRRTSPTPGRRRLRSDPSPNEPPSSSTSSRIPAPRALPPARTAARASDRGATVVEGAVGCGHGRARTWGLGSPRGGGASGAGCGARARPQRRAGNATGCPGPDASC